MLKYQGAEIRLSDARYPSSNSSTIPKAIHSVIYLTKTPCKFVSRPSPTEADTNILKLITSSTGYPAYVRDVGCCARRRIRYDEDDEEENDEGHGGYNEEIRLLEMYTQTARDEVLRVKAIVDDQEEEVVIFKGFSSSLTYGTSPDPSKSILPAKAVIKSIDRIKGPFDPSNIEFIEKGLTWDALRRRLPNQF